MVFSLARARQDLVHGGFTHNLPSNGRRSLKDQRYQRIFGLTLLDPNKWRIRQNDHKMGR